MIGDARRRRWLPLLLAGSAAVGTGCGGDGAPPTEVEPVSPVVRAVSGDAQREAPGDSVPDPMVVAVTREGSAVQGAEVSWTVVDSAGPDARLTAASSTTDAEGRASSRLVLGSAAGVYRIRAALASGDDSASFSATAEVPEAAVLRRDGGDGQTGSVDASLSDSLVVLVSDQFGDPLPGADVRFEVARGASAGAAVDPETSTTDAAGRAAASLTLGSKNGTYRAVAAAGSDSVFFSAEATGGSEALLAVDSVRPTPLEAGASATVFGAGFGAGPDAIDVFVDGKPASVTAAADDRLEIDVPTFTDECLPRRSVETAVAVGPDTAPPVASDLVPAPPPLSLAAGEDTVLAGPDEVGCVHLPGADAGGAEYEVVATTVPDVLGSAQTVELHVNGNGAARRDRRRPAGRIDGRRVRGPGPAEVPDWKRAQYRWDRRLRERERQWIGETRRKARLAPSMSRTVGRALATASVGDTATFQVSCTSQENVVARVKTVSDAAVVYEDTVMASRGVGFADARYDSIAARFDTLSFAVDTTYFGAPADIDENGRVVMLFSPAVNRLDGNYGDGFIVGFFCGLDLALGNQAEMFYLVSPDPSGEFTPAADGGLPGDFVRSIIEGTVIHEFQHLINAQIGGGSGPRSVSDGGAQATWLNEGLSHLAEEVGGHAAAGLGPGRQLGAGELTADGDALDQFYRANFRNLARYLAAPHTGTGPVSTTANFRTRGAAWSFVRHVLDRFGPAGSEADLTRALVQSAVADARGAVEDAVRTAADTSVVFEDVVADWGAMLSVEDRSDLAGSPRRGLELSSYRLRNVYGDPAFGGEGSYPLAPPGAVAEVDLAGTAVVSGTLSPSSGRHVRLISPSASAGTGLRLSAGGGGDLGSSVEPRLVIVRTK